MQRITGYHLIPRLAKKSFLAPAGVRRGFATKLSEDEKQAAIAKLAGSAGPFVWQEVSE